MGISRNSIQFLIILIASSLLAACSSTGTDVPSITTPTATVSPAETVTITSHPASATSTPESLLTATSQSNAMQKDMQKLAEQKLVSSPNGTYYRVQDFTGAWAKLSYFHWWPLNRKPTNFAIRANVSWDTATPNGNPSKSGCGFVFYETGADNLHFSFISTDGYVRNYRMEKKVFADLKANYAGKFNYPSDSAKIMLVVDYQWITFFVNDKQVLRFQDDHLKDGGNLAFAVASGSNNDFGTRCSFENVELWEFN
jgi:hypothetical protein